MLGAELGARDAGLNKTCTVSTPTVSTSTVSILESQKLRAEGTQGSFLASSFYLPRGGSKGQACGGTDLGGEVRRRVNLEDYFEPGNKSGCRREHGPSSTPRLWSPHPSHYLPLPQEFAPV